MADRPPEWTLPVVPMDELNEIDDDLTFTTDDELELLRGSSLAIMLATIKFLQARGIDLAEWTTELSETFAGGWDTSEPWSPVEFLDAVVAVLQQMVLLVVVRHRRHSELGRHSERSEESRSSR